MQAEQGRLKVLLVAGARPNFMKIAPIYREALKFSRVDCRIVHTGQHYDREMSQSFFDDLAIASPHHFLNAGSGTHAAQTARIMVAFEEVCLTEHPDLVMVVGDVNSTLACSIVAKKLHIKVAHVEAGLRSFDRRMPEEINRLVTDAITDFYFVTEESGQANLVSEGVPDARIHLVGNVMIDNLLFQKARLEKDGGEHLPSYGIKQGLEDYFFLTLHRPSNVDDPGILAGIVEALGEIAREHPIVFPVHPRTRKMLEAFELRLSPKIVQLPPLGFTEALFFWKDARLVLTDSGGLQEETTALGIPCVTLRENTERPITLTLGTNVLAGNRREGIIEACRKALAGNSRKGCVPPLWDGRAAGRIWQVLLDAGLPVSPGASG